MPIIVMRKQAAIELITDHCTFDLVSLVNLTILVKGNFCELTVRRHFAVMITSDV